MSSIQSVEFWQLTLDPRQEYPCISGLRNVQIVKRGSKLVAWGLVIYSNLSLSFSCISLTISMNPGQFCNCSKCICNSAKIRDILQNLQVGCKLQKAEAAQLFSQFASSNLSANYPTVVHLEQRLTRHVLKGACLTSGM